MNNKDIELQIRLSNTFGFYVSVVSSRSWSVRGATRTRYVVKRPGSKKLYHALEIGGLIIKENT